MLRPLLRSFKEFTIDTIFETIKLYSPLSIKFEGVKPRSWYNSPGDHIKIMHEISHVLGQILCLSTV